MARASPGRACERFPTAKYVTRTPTSRCRLRRLHGVGMGRGRGSSGGAAVWRRRAGRIGPGAARIALRVALLAPLVSGTLLRPAHAGAPGVWSNFVPVGGGQAAYDARRHRLIRPDGFGHTWALDLDTDSSWVGNGGHSARPRGPARPRLPPGGGAGG